MYKNISALEKAIREILIELNQTNQLPSVENNKDLAYALYCCCEHKFIANLVAYQCMDMNYVFDSNGNVHVTEAGLQFIDSTSFLNIFKKNLFTILKGTAGFVIGVVGTLVASYFVWYFGWL